MVRGGAGEGEREEGGRNGGGGGSDMSFDTWESVLPQSRTSFGAARHLGITPRSLRHPTPL